MSKPNSILGLPPDLANTPGEKMIRDYQPLIKGSLLSRILVH